MQGSNSNMFTTFSLPSSKTSSLLSKREQFKQQIRREYLSELFASKRKQILQKEISKRQRQAFLSYLGEMIKEFKSSPNNSQAQKVITKIWQVLTKDNIDVQSGMRVYGGELVRMFVMFPLNRYSIQILYQMIVYSYQDTFQIDDKKFTLLHHQNSFQISLQRKQLSQYQQAIATLLHTIDHLIPTLGERCSTQNTSSYQQQQLLQKQNNKIQKRVKLYLACLKQLVVRVNSFVLRYQYVQKYLLKWTQQLLIKYDFGKSHILYYLFAVSRFIIPFKSLVNQQEVYKNNNKYYKLTYSQHQHQRDHNLLQKLFHLCLPTHPDVNMDKVPFLSMLVIKSIFTYQQLHIQQLVNYIKPICTLIRVVLNYQRYYKLKNVANIFQFLSSIVGRFNDQMADVDTTQGMKQIMKEVNLLEILTQMEFLSTFDLYFKVENNIICQPLFHILTQLIEYCIIFNLDINDLLSQKSLFPEICHKIDLPDQNIIKTNLKSIQLICQYAQKHNKKQYFVKMVNYGVDDRIQHLMYHMDQWISQRAINIKETYFNEDQLYNYTEIQCQLERYGEDEGWKMYDRHDVYEI